MSKNYYKKSDVKQFRERFNNVHKRWKNLSAEIIRQKFETDLGNQFACHGYLRRVNLLCFCLKNVFNLLQPDLDGIPSRDAAYNATIQIHTFLINVIGACDNLAWVIVFEKNLRKPNGQELSRLQVGLRLRNNYVRVAFSENNKTRLAELDGWFGSKYDFRDPLAHRIPLYVPQFGIREDDEDKYNKLRSEKTALLNPDYIDEYSTDEGSKEFVEKMKCIDQKIDELKIFRPFYAQSETDNTPLVIIHPQLLKDLEIVLELGEMVLVELTADFYVQQNRSPL